MKNNNLKIYQEISNSLGEGLNLHPSGIFWLDITDAKLFFLSIKKPLQIYQLPEQASAIWKIETNIIYLASESGICTFNLVNHNWLLYAAYPANKTKNDMRANDGCAINPDTFLFGTMQKKPTGPNGSLYLAKSNKLVEIYDGIGIPNSFIRMSETTFLISDSLEKIVYLFTLNNEFTKVIDKKIWLDLSRKNYTPDGGCKDKEGNIYLAIWDGSCVNKYDKDANFIASFGLPVLRPTNCKLALDGNSLYVTSAKEDLTLLELKKNPYSGALFQIGLCSDYA